MKINYRLNIILTLCCTLLFAITAQAQTEKKCDPADKDCQTSEKEKATENKDEAKADGNSAKFEAVRFVPNSGSFATQTPKEQNYRPNPTPTPDDAAAAPAKPASNGSNPADLITRIEMKYQYQNFGGAYLHGVPIIRGDYAFTPKISFRMDLPILTFHPKAQSADPESGIGDIVTSMTFVKIFSRKFVGAVVPRVDFPTATNRNLGSGKYSFKPTVAGVTPLAPGLLFVGALEYRVSFAGHRDRADIHELSIKPIILKSFLSGSLKGYYANPKLEIIVDFENNNNTTLQAGAEFGKALNKNVVVFVIPTFHAAGTKKESFKLEAGFRYLFR